MKNMSNEQRFNTLMESVHDYAIFMLDLSGNINVWNKGATNLFGYSSNEVIGKNYSIFFTKEDRELGIPNTELKKATAGGRVVDDRWHLRRNGSKFWANGVIYYTPSGYIKLLRDNTVVRDLQLKAAAANQNLEEANRHKAEFLAMLGHELRNPLAPIYNALHIISAHSEDWEQQSKAINVVQRQVQQLAKIVDDLLDVGRISRGQVKLEKKKVRLQNLIQHAVETVQPNLDRYKHKLTLNLPSELKWINVDPLRLEQILTNVLTNAIKYTEPGGQIKLSAEQPWDSLIRITIADNGTGIAPNMLSKIFDLFSQAERTLDRSQGGLGVGLTVVKKLVEMHNGTITASSAGLGKGSSFTIDLPVLVAPPVVTFNHDNPDRSKTKILIIEDNIDEVESLESLLKGGGYRFKSLLTGKNAVNIIKEYKPNILLLDIGLPGYNGYEIAEAIRDMPNKPTILAITGYTQPEDIEKSKNAGCNYHLAKPVLPATLLSILDKHYVK